MGINKNHKQILITSIICCTYLLLTIFYYHIDKYTSGLICLFLTLLIPITFITMVVYCIKGVIGVFRNRKNLTFCNFVPLAICLGALTYMLFSPVRLDSENFENRSKIVLRACYEGTQNQATLKFRENQTFELHWTGVFFSSNWHYGTYKQEADTIFLYYSTKKPLGGIGDTIIIKDDLLITINKYKVDSTRYFVPFYLGYCKGLN